MPARSADAVAMLAALTAGRWEAFDPLLPPPMVLPPGCGVELTVTGPGGRPGAVGHCEHWRGALGSLDLTWGAARRFKLSVLAAGPGVASSLDVLLSRWREHVAGVAGADGEDSSAMVTWPSRDVEGAGVLLRHGLAPLAVVAARVTGGHVVPDQAVSNTGRAGLEVRRAQATDVAAVIGLGLEVIRFDARFGVVTERSWTAEALHREAVAVLAQPEPWVWLAERESGPVGMIWVEPPSAAGWIAPMTRLAPVAYVLLMGVAAGERGRGVGALLAAHAHRQIEAAGVAVTLLHYALPNPLSVPFWSRQGYRPFWTVWETRPARMLR
jgi:GNAT superfamily N-acetyltransferase